VAGWSLPVSLDGLMEASDNRKTTGNASSAWWSTDWPTDRPTKQSTPGSVINVYITITGLWLPATVVSQIKDAKAASLDTYKRLVQSV